MNLGMINRVEVRAEIRVRRINSRVGGIAGVNVATIQYSNITNNNTNRAYTIIYGNGDLGGVAGHNTTGYGRRGHIRNIHVHHTTIQHFLVNHSRSVGGVVGFNTSATLEWAIIHDVIVRNGGQSNASHIAPAMGLIVGQFQNSTVHHFGRHRSSMNYGNLSVSQPTHFGSLGWGGAGRGWGGQMSGNNDILVPTSGEIVLCNF